MAALRTRGVVGSAPTVSAARPEATDACSIESRERRRKEERQSAVVQRTVFVCTDLLSWPDGDFQAALLDASSELSRIGKDLSAILELLCSDSRTAGKPSSQVLFCGHPSDF